MGPYPLPTSLDRNAVHSGQPPSSGHGSSSPGSLNCKQGPGHYQQAVSERRVSRVHRYVMINQSANGVRAEYTGTL